MSTVIINCECGASCEHKWEAFRAYLYYGREYCLACDFCNRVPNINYGGMTV